MDSPSLPTLGIDPGATCGGAALLDPDGRTVTNALSWARRDRKAGPVWLVTLPSGREVVVADLGLVAASVAGFVEHASPYVASYDLVVEGLFVPPAGRLNPQSVIPLAESAGFMLGALCGRARRTLRPRAVEWRHEVLGLSPRTKADAAEAHAVRMGRAAFVGLGALADVGHVVEAAWMARFGWVQARSAHAA